MASTTDKQPARTALELLEEDDEFEEFEPSEGPRSGVEEAAEDLQLWQDTWDDDDAGDAFTEQLRQQLETAANESGQ